jgi:hypothetical protein
MTVISARDLIPVSGGIRLLRFVFETAYSGGGEVCVSGMTGHLGGCEMVN